VIYVTLETVKKMMEREKRKIYYLRDQDKKLIFYNDDESPSYDEIFDELDTMVSDLTGNYCEIELPEFAKGRGKKGGDQYDKKFTYRIKLTPADTGGSSQGSGMMQMVFQLMNNVSDLKSEIIANKSKADIDKLREELKLSKSGGRSAVLDEFAEILMDKYRTGKKVTRAAKKAKDTAAISDETKSETEHRQDTKRVMLALKKLKKIDENFINNLEFLAVFAAKNPDYYNTLISEMRKEK